MMNSRETKKPKYSIFREIWATGEEPWKKASFEGVEIF